MILVTGADGMVGSYARGRFGNEAILTDKNEMDIADKDRVFNLISKHKPAYVLHLAAETDVDKCEIDIDCAFRINAKGTENVALACKRYDATLIYISTAAVFGGTGKHTYTEFDAPSPQNVYSRSKYEGEKNVCAVLDKYYIFRAGWMAGGGPDKDKKFVGKIIKLCRVRTEIDAVNDKFGSPTFARDFINGIKAVVQTKKFGLYHLVNKGVCSRFEIAKEIAKLVNPGVKINPVSSDKFPLAAPRPVYEVIKNHKLELMGMDLMPHWKESLKEYIREWRM